MSADSVGGQLREEIAGPFSGVTSSYRVREEVPESDARSVPPFTSSREANAIGQPGEQPMPHDTVMHYVHRSRRVY